MITVRIPKDIREYKEKLVMGLTARQIICVLIGGAIIAPIIYYGRKFMSSDVLGYLVMFIAAPIGLLGFYQPEGMPFERFLLETIKFGRSKKELVFTTKNSFSAEQDVKDIKADKIPEKTLKKISIERAVILDEAEKPISLKETDEKLVTVKNGGKKPKKEKKPKKSKAEKKEERLIAAAEKINAKRLEDPYYKFTSKEQKTLRRVVEMKERKRKAELKKKLKPVKKTNILARRRKTNQKSVLPLTVQEAIPYIADYGSGIFEIIENVYSKLYIIDDINYHTATEDKQVEIFALYAEFLNTFDDNAEISVYIDNRVVSKSEQERRIFYSLTGDENDNYRTEYNKIMQTQMEVGRNEMVQAKYISVTITTETYAEAASRFRKIDMQVEDGIKRLGTNARALTTNERLEILHDKLRRGHEGEFKVDFKILEKQGLSSKDYIAPSALSFDRKHFMIDDEYYRVMYLNNLPTNLDDGFFSDLVDNNFPLTATVNIHPLAQHEALKKVNNQRTGMEMNILQAQKKAGRSGYSPELAINQKLKASYEDSLELYDDLTKKQQKLFFVTILLMFSAPTLEELDERESQLSSKARKVTSQLQTLTCRMLDGFKSCLPMGVPVKLHVDRALTSESTAVFVPFSCQELFDMGGFYYGLNGVSRNLIMLNRTRLSTPSGLVFGMSGSGKSFAVKREMLNVLLRDNVTPLLIIDPENEYTPFVEAFGGEIIKISADSDNYINPMEMSENYGLDERDDPDAIPLEKKKEKAMLKKSEYIMSIITCMLGNTLSPQQKTFVDRSVKEVYRDYLDNDFDPGHLPNMENLQDVFDAHKSESEEARLVAEGAEYYTKGSLNVFSHHSNVNLANRIVSFNIRDLGKQLMAIGLQVVLDYVWNTMCQNNNNDKQTYCYADEVHVLFKNKESADYLSQLYKRGRKYSLVITGITQDVGDLLSTDEGRAIIQNSDFLLLLRQANANLKLLAPMLGMSEAQCSDLQRASIGSGLIKAGNVIVPFRDNFPKDSPLYPLMSTNANERIAAANEKATA